jgi:hypothetical protein
MKKVVDIEALTREKDEALERVRNTPFSERDYTEYNKLFMKLKYHTNKEERTRQIEHGKKVLKDIYEDAEKTKQYQQYQLKKYYEYKALKVVL